MFSIYQIVNRINGKSYIGFTTKNPPLLRWKNHQWVAKNSINNRHFHNAIRKYGPENFDFVVLEEGWDPKIGLNLRESFWISALKPEYNGTLGGEGGKTVGNTGKKASPETRALIGAKSRGRFFSEECRAKMSANRKGRQLSSLTIAKIKASKLGKKRGPNRPKVK